MLHQLAQPVLEALIVVVALKGARGFLEFFKLILLVARQTDLLKMGLGHEKFPSDFRQYSVPHHLDEEGHRDHKAASKNSGFPIGPKSDSRILRSRGV